MTRTAQLRHVLTKDLREHRYLIALYLLLVSSLAGIAQWLGDLSRPPSIEIGFIPMVALVVVSVLLSAAVIQSDPPARPEAFWASRPLDPLAVLAAKATFVLVAVVLPAVVALLVVGVAYGVAGAELPSAVGVQIRWHLVVALVAALTAAVTRELRAFVTAAIGIVVGVAAIAFASPRWDAWTPGLRLALLGAGTAGAMTILWRIYATRDARAGLRIATVAVALVILSAFRTGDGLEIARPARDPSTAAPRFALQSALGESYSQSNGVPSFPAMLTALDGPGDRMLWLRDATLRIHLVDGTVIDAPIDRGRTPLSSNVFPQLPGIRWIGRNFTRPSIRRHVVMGEVRAKDWRRIDRGVRRLELRGVIQQVEPFVRASAPLRPGEETTAPQLRLRITETDISDRGAFVRLRGTQLHGGDDGARDMRYMSYGSYGVSEFAIASPSRGEAMSLPNWGSMGGNLWIAGPGLTVLAFDTRLSTSEGNGRAVVITDRDDGISTWSTEPSSAPPLRDQGWFADARLLVIGWRSLGHTPIHVVADVDPRERRRPAPPRR